MSNNHEVNTTGYCETHKREYFQCMSKEEELTERIEDRLHISMCNF